MEFSDCIRAFSDEGMSVDEIRLRLALEFPCFSGKDLLGAFESVSDNYRKRADRIPEPGFTVTALGNMNTGLFHAAYHSDGILRNLYRLMFDTDRWDEEILFQPDFADGFSRIVERAKSDFKKTKTKTWCDNSKLDLYEKLAEFRDRLGEKIQNAAFV